MSAAPLTVHNAEIATAAVEVKTLTIKGKQVTLAVFRQIQVEDLFDRELAYRGNPWGRVNYHVGCDNVSGPHWHVVWQKDLELRRAIVRSPSRDAPGPDYSLRDTWVLLAARYLAVHTDAQDSPEAGLRALVRSSRGEYAASVGGVHAWATSTASEQASRAAQDIRYRFATAPDAPELDQVQAAWDALQESWRSSDLAWGERWKRWREIESLPQLFIAV